MHFVLTVPLEVLKVNEKQREGREPLLTVDDEFLSLLVAYYYRAKEVVAIICHSSPWMILLVAVEELGC